MQFMFLFLAIIFPTFKFSSHIIQIMWIYDLIY